jgi:hypothetical protein
MMGEKFIPVSFRYLLLWCQIICLRENLTCTPIIQLLNKISSVSWYSISIHYFPHLVPIYRIKSLFKIYKHQIKVWQTMLCSMTIPCSDYPHLHRLDPILGEPLATMAWCLLRMQSERTASNLGVGRGANSLSV